MVYFRIQGNLGNVLFQHAAALSLRRGRVVGVGDSAAAEKLRSYGRLFADTEVVPEPPAGVVTVRQEKCLPTGFPPDDGRDLYLEGYFQSERYFDRDLVYEWARPSAERVDALKMKYGDWLSRPGVVGISVRRGDYLRKGSWHPFVGERFFRDCLARLLEARDFVVCSDGMEWCRRFFPKAFPGRRFLFVEGESVLDQLAVHVLCANNVISNSSYSWWGAWLAKERRRRAGLSGTVLAPSMWYGYAAKRAGATWSDLYFDGTEVVPNRYSPRTWFAAHWPWLAERD